jgi:hypothetical protein
MFTKRITATLFAIAIASSLIVASCLVGSAFAAKKERSIASDPKSTTINSDGEDKSSTGKSKDANTGDSNGATGDSNDFSGKELKKLSKCQSAAAANGQLTLAELSKCYRVGSDPGQGEETKDQSNSAQSNDRLDEGQGGEQLKSSSLNGQKTETMREGFPF